MAGKLTRNNCCNADPDADPDAKSHKTTPKVERKNNFRFSNKKSFSPFDEIF